MCALGSSWALLLLAGTAGAADKVPGFDGIDDAMVFGTPTDSTAVAALTKESAAACAAACEADIRCAIHFIPVAARSTSHRSPLAPHSSCVSFDWCPSPSPAASSCSLNSAGRAHADYKCCSCTPATGTDCLGCSHYEKLAFPPAPPRPPPPPTLGCAGVDVVVVLDRSSSAGATSWNTEYLPFLESVLDEIAPSAATSTRLGVVVYPSAAGASAGDVAGDATVTSAMSSDPAPLTALISAVTSQSSTHCVASPLGTLEFPCGGWSYSPMWRGLARAEEMLFPDGDEVRHPSRLLSPLSPHGFSHLNLAITSSSHLIASVHLSITPPPFHSLTALTHRSAHLSPTRMLVSRAERSSAQGRHGGHRRSAL